MLPVPRVPDGLTIALFPTGNSRRQGTTAHIPDNGICERFHKTVLDEFYRVAFRKKLYRSLDELQADLDAWLKEYNPASWRPSRYVIEENRVG